MLADRFPDNKVTLKVDCSDFSTITLLILFAKLNSDVVPLGPRIPGPVRFL